MSPRAAARLESLNFRRVCDYVAGKADWLAYGLPIVAEPRNGTARTLVDLIDHEFPTCRLSETLEEARSRTRNSDFSVCPVVNDAGIVLGWIQGDGWNASANQSVEKVMEAGPTTLRPSSDVDHANELLVKANQKEILVTSSDGKLMGIFKR